MDRWRRNPSLYQINAITWTGRLSREFGRAATLYDIPDAELDRLAAMGFDLVWVMAVWQRGRASIEIALANPHVPPQFTHALPDWQPDDVVGSPFAIQDYVVDAGLGGDDALADLRRRLSERKMGLILDYVPNHIARDHRWVHDHPEWLVSDQVSRVDREPERYFRADTVRGPRAIAFGKDPHFVGWIDTAQLNYRHPRLRAEMCRVIADIATRADGVRCDMAMLVFDDVFIGTWPETRSDHPEPPNQAFWPQAIDAARSVHPTFVFIAEVYWAMEGRMLENGFDYAYDKALYDHLRAGDIGAIQQAVRGSVSYLHRTVHFVENHDEEPAIEAFGSRTEWGAAISATLPGLRFFHEGQFDGRRVRLPVQLGRPNGNPPDRERLRFYDRLLHLIRLPVLRDGRFRVVDVEPAPTKSLDDESFWNVLVYQWDRPESKSVVYVVANLSGTRSRARLRLDLLPLVGRPVDVVDLLHSTRRTISGKTLVSDGLVLDLSPYDVHAYTFETHDTAPSDGA